MKRIAGALGISMVVMWLQGAYAADLNIDDSVEGQITLTHDGNWEFGAMSNGTNFGPRVGGSTTVVGESCTAPDSLDTGLMVSDRWGR